MAVSLLLGGSWVVISGGYSRRTVNITHIRELITTLITTHEPLSTIQPSPPKPFGGGAALGFRPKAPWPGGSSLASRSAWLTGASRREKS